MASNMQAANRLIADDVVGVPGQNLTPCEMVVLVGLANGNSPNDIGTALQADTLTIRSIESSIKAKLGAKTHPHMIARGFTLGVLFSRALCIFLALVSAVESQDEGSRTRSSRRSRNSVAHTRITRTAPGSSNGGRGEPSSNSLSLAASCAIGHPFKLA